MLYVRVKLSEVIKSCSAPDKKYNYNNTYIGFPPKSQENITYGLLNHLLH